MAEIEHFVDPNDKSHKKFHMVKNAYLPLYTACNQVDNKGIIRDLSMGDAVSNGTVGNETLGYFMVRTYLFLTDCGIRPDGIRFRQHRDNEMAHYAKDCWDAEVETSYGWIEVAGHSDRSCFDLTRHADKTKVELKAARPIKPIQVEEIRVICAKTFKGLMGKALGKASQEVFTMIENFTEDQKVAYAAQMETDGKIVLKVGEKDVPIEKA